MFRYSTINLQNFFENNFGITTKPSVSNFLIIFFYLYFSFKLNLKVFLNNFDIMCKHASDNALSPDLFLVTKRAFLLQLKSALLGQIEYPTCLNTKNQKFHHPCK